MTNENSTDWATPDRLRYEVENHPDYASYVSWKTKYPHILDKFRSLTAECLTKKRRFGMWLIANKLRWDYWWQYDEEFKISNDYTALVTRELMLENPDIMNFCRIKKMSWADGFDKPMKQELFNECLL